MFGDALRGVLQEIGGKGLMVWWERRTNCYYGIGWRGRRLLVTLLQNMHLEKLRKNTSIKHNISKEANASTIITSLQREKHGIKT